MHPRILAFRPASVVERLDPRSAACPISTRELLGPAAELGLVLPLVRAPVAAVARGVLVAAKELQSVLGLALPAGAPPEPWFESVTKAADELAAGLPLFLSAEVTVEGEGATQVERAFHEAWRLVGAGVTHLAIDVGAIEAGERARVIAEIAEAGIEHGVCVEVTVPLAEGAQARQRLARVLEELARRGSPADLASVRCPAPVDRDEARLQAAALARFCQAVAGVPVMRRGPVTPPLLEALRGSPLRVCEDGGVAFARALEALPAIAPPVEGEETRESPLERAAAQLPAEQVERLEARAYVDGLEFIEALGARGSAPALGRLLEQRLGR